jgi:CHAT domain-containing protein/Tfp pilus assembly protein PilF
MDKVLRAIPACVLLAAFPVLLPAQTEKPREWTVEEQALAAKAAKLNDEGVKLYDKRQMKESVEKLAAAIEIRRKLYPLESFPAGHADLAISLNNLGVVLDAQGQAAKALPYHEQALAMYRTLYPPERFPDGHPAYAQCLRCMGLVLQAQGKAGKALPYYEEALAMNKKLYPPKQFPDGHIDLARSMDNMGLVLQALGQAGKALPYYEEALAMRKKLYPPERPDGHPDLAASLNNMGFVLEALGQAGKALPYYEEALAMNRKLYPPERFPDGHPDLARSLNNLGSVLEALGQAGKAKPHFEQALAMRKKLYPPERFPDGHPDLAKSLNNLGFVLRALGQAGKGLPYFEEALAMHKKLYPPDRFPDGHPDLAQSLNTMGAVLRELGDVGKALPYYEEALAMNRKLYPPDRFPDGHPGLARRLNNMGIMLEAQGQAGKALPYHEEALAMHKKLYPPDRFPDGHPDLARGLNNLGNVLQALGQAGKALPCHEQALAMKKKLYPPDRFPDGHPDLALSLNNLGNVLRDLGQHGKALPYYEEALAMNRKLYPPDRFPDGHCDLARTLNNMGVMFQALGQNGKAMQYHEQALALYQKLCRREDALGSEAQALAYRQSQPRNRDYYLSAAVPVAEATYEAVWHSRGDVLPLLQARHRQMLALTRGSAEAAADFRILVVVRQQLAGLQNALPKDPEALGERDKQLSRLTDEQDRLERKLAAALPEFQHLRELADKGPADLAKALPRDAAFVDLVRYNVCNKDKWDGRRYAAFVLQSGKEAKVIDLGDAAPIDAAASAWREHLPADKPSLAPAKLRELVWDKVSAQLPAGTKRVYLCPDGNLARVPFAALPGKDKGTILLEDYALAVVPSGPWLLEQLLYPPKPAEAPDRLLAVGSVDYGKAADHSGDYYPALPATGGELRRVLEAFGRKDDDALSGAAATAKAVRERLPEATYAHFATHGYFDAKGLTEERERQEKALKTWAFQDEGSRLGGAGLRNPAGYTGLVLAGANAAPKDDPDRGVLTGLNILDLPLDNLRLCVLSACETGLGELTEAEGVLGLQQSFHAAGCPNVVGSLWRVDDEATAALMTQFYHELRANKRSPIDALREAQLTLYRHPEQIPALAGSRGKVNQEEAVKQGSKPAEAKPGEAASKAPTALWAAFVLSGTGQ